MLKVARLIRYLYLSEINTLTLCMNVKKISVSVTGISPYQIMNKPPTPSAP